MTTGKGRPHRHAGRVMVAVALVAVAVAVATGGPVTTSASADKLSDLRAQAQALTTKIQTLGRQEDALGQRYDQGMLAVKAADASVAQAAQQAAAASASAAHARAALRQEAVDAYIQHGGGSSTGSLTSANDSLLRAEYVDTLATNRSDALDQYRQALLQAQTAGANLAAQEAADKKVVARLAADRQLVVSAQQQVQTAESQVQGAIATEVARIQAAQEAAAAAAALAAAQQRQRQQAAAEAAARTQQALIAQLTPRGDPSPGGAGRPNDVTVGGGSSVPPPPPGRGASGAVAAALSRLGDPYVWGAAGPGAFDCSGLVMWAYAQVGIYLPHFSGAQYSGTTHIPMSALQPGDLVFPGDPGQHVAMYIGGGQIVEAPYTGAVVHVIPLSSWFVYASRVA